jgi:hypothetical protein
LVQPIRGPDVIVMKAASLILLVLIVPAAADDKRPLPPPRSSGWTIGPIVNGKNYSFGMPAQLATNADGTFSFTFPDCAAGGEVHYVTQPRGPLKPGGIIRARFATAGPGRIVPVVAHDKPPPQVRLFFQQAGDDWSGQGQFEFYRWYSMSVGDISANGEFLLSSTLEGFHWTSVFGKTGAAAPAGAFAKAAGEAGLIGLTFGGRSFAGHGECSEGGAVRFTLQAFSVE